MNSTLSTMIALGVTSASFVALAENPAWAQSAPPSRETVASWLRQQEQFSRNFRCEYECVCSTPTDPQYLAFIERMQAKLDKEGIPGRYIRTQNEADKNSYRARFWRKGAKQREDKFRLGEDPATAVPSIVAFDGQMVRNVSAGGDNGQVAASIYTERSTLWNGTPREDPYTFLYAFYLIPYSELVTGAKTFQAEALGADQPGFVRVSIDCGPEGLQSGNSFTLTFDDHRRLVGRDIYRSEPKKGKYLYEKRIYSAYQSSPDASGEAIWYPRRNVNTLYLEGTAGLTYDYAIKEIEFNGDIPDSLFEPQIPKQASVYDGVTGLGWLPAGQRPAELFPVEARARRWWWTVAVGGAVIFVAAGVFLAHRRRQRTTPGHPAGKPAGG